MKKLFALLCVFVVYGGYAELLDRPRGINVGTRMNLRPSVSVGYTYDTNIDSDKDGRSSTSWSVNPALGMTYKADKFDLSGQAFYRYHLYERRTHRISSQSYGENLSFTWADQAVDTRGWRLSLSETYQYISQDDDMMASDGRGIWRDRQCLQFSGALQRNFTERFHASLNGGYYMLDYENKSDSYAPLYGWDRWNVGGTVGYARTKWMDFLLSANYNMNQQDNYREIGTGESDYKKQSQGWSIHGGIGSHATERISYRVMGGWSHYEYASGAHKSDGFTYSVSANWRMADRWRMMLLASSYYQPSEREYGSSLRVDSVSWGLGNALIKGKLNWTLDLACRYATHEMVTYESDDYNELVLTGRLGVNYTFNRFLSAYGHAEYQVVDQDKHESSDYVYDYDRWRLTAGVRLTY